MTSTLQRAARLLAALALWLACPVHAQEAEWTRLNREAEALSSRGNYGQATGIARQALGVAEKTFGPDHPAVGQSLHRLAFMYYMDGQYVQAEPLYKRSLAMMEKDLGPDHPIVATGLNNLAELYRAQGRYGEAEPLYKRALVIIEKARGPHHSDVASILNGLATLYFDQGKYAQAEPLYKRSVAISEKGLGPGHQVLNNLAELYRNQGQYTQAESFYKRALAISEKARGPDHPEVAKILNNLAGLYQAGGQNTQVEPLYKRSLAISEKTLGPDHPDVAGVLNNLAVLYVAQGQYARAEPLYKRALAIRGKAFGPDHPEVAKSLGNLAGLYRAQGQYTQAEPLYKRALQINEKALGPDHPDLAPSLHNLALLYDTQGNYAQAEPLYKRALQVSEKAVGADHPDVATSLHKLAMLYDTQGNYAQALSLERRVSAIYRQRIVAGGTGDAAVREAAQNRPGFLTHLSLLFRNPGGEPVAKIADEAIQIVQLEQASGTASAIAKMAARFAGGDDALASLVRRKQDAGDRRARDESRLVDAASKPPQERKAAAEQRSRDDIARAGKEIEMIDAELTRRFPEYQELTRPEPLSVTQIRALLRPGEAMLVYAFGSGSFMWVVKPDSADFRAFPVDVNDMAKKVATVRTQMEFDGNSRVRRVSVGLLHELYQSLFAPALPLLAGVKHVIVVPAGPLQSLPFSMLVASPPPEIKSDVDYRQVDWLARHYALSVLPSVSSIRAFRQFNKTGSVQEPFGGFGDPLIGGKGGSARGNRRKIDIATVFRNRPVRNALNGMQATEIADVEAIRMQPRLPETADELRSMAKVLKSDEKSLWMQENATETRIKRMDLSKYRTLAFATHGVMAGQLEGVGEPGLIFTPPQQGSLEDDGYLSAGEIAKLKLNADWVVLSACNTAAADGTPGAEGLSGLAKAFFYAGARSLLVSHWPVASEATVPLTTGMLREYEANPGQGKAEAHRKAMLALIDTPNHPEYAHPLFWAPFVVVGEGGAGGQVNAGSARR